MATNKRKFGEGAIYPYGWDGLAAHQIRVDPSGYMSTVRAATIVSDRDGAGDLISTTRVPVAHMSFNYPATPGNMNTRIVVVQETSTGTPVAAPTVSVSAARECNLFSGQAGSGTSSNPNIALVKCRRTARYIPGHTISARYSARFTVASAPTEQAWGIGQLGEDMIVVGHFGVNNGGSTDFAIRLASFVTGSQVNTFVSQSAFNQDPLDGTGPSGMVLDPTKGNVFHIEVKWYGYASITLFIEQTSTGYFVPFHTFENANTLDGPSFSNPSALQLFGYAIHADYSASPVPAVTAYSTSGGLFTNGKSPQYGILEGVSNTKNTAASVILSVRVSNKFPVGGSTNNYNFTRMQNATVTMGTGANKTGIFTFVLDAVLASPSFSAVRANTSMLELDTTAATYTNGIVWAVVALQPGESVIVPLEEILYPGDTITVHYTSTGTAGDITATINFEELW